MTLIEAIEGLCGEAEDLASPGEQEALRSVRSRLDEPLRVAIAGRVKAGKSTLLNALVGERLAPTDAGECTRIVTWYRYGMGYEVEAHLPGGEVRPLDFDRSDGRLTVDLDGLAPADVERLEVRWPSGRLSNLTLIDTPGLEKALYALRPRLSVNVLEVVFFAVKGYEWFVFSVGSFF